MWVTAGLLAAALAVWTWPRQLARGRGRRVLELPPGVWRAAGAGVAERLAAWAGRRGRDARRREPMVLGFVEALVTELEAGQPPASAVSASAERFSTDPVLRRLARHVALGGDAADALRAAAAQPGASDLWAVVVCLEVGSRAGAGLAEALRPLVASIRDERELQREIHGQLAAPRASARLLASLPVLVWGLGITLGADPLRVLFTTPYGIGCLVAGVALELAGLRWVERMAASVAR